MFKAKAFLGNLVFRDDVAEHYRSKGYKVHHNVKVRGQSGAVHACDLVAQGPLGNLVVSFGDDMPFEAAEMGAVRRSARDVGATPVVACERLPAGIRQLAARAGVVLMDRDALEALELAAPQMSAEPEAMAWPDPERRHPVQVSPPIKPVEAPKSEPFAWLPKKAPVEAPRPAGTMQLHVPAHNEPMLLRWVLVALVGGASAGLVFFGLQSLF